MKKLNALNAQAVKLTSQNLALMIVFLLALIFSLNVQAQEEGDFRTTQSGSWNNKDIWEEYDDEEWEEAKHAPNKDSDVSIFIHSNHTVVFNQNEVKLKNLVVETGGKLYRNSSSNEKKLLIYGDIICNGIIGNGETMDKISLQINGESTNISGNGECSFYKISKNSNEDDQTQLIIAMDVRVTTNSGSAITNTKNNTNLQIIVNPGASLETHATIDLRNGNQNSNKTCSLYLKSDENGYGSLLSPSVDDSDASNTTIERYLSENRWHYISSPVENTTASVFNDIYLMQFNEPTGQWAYITDPAQVLENEMQGYATWTASSLLGNTTVQFQGTINTGYKEIDLTYTESTTGNNRGFNFVGNPYSSAIDWDYDGANGWTKNNIDDAIYQWNGDMGSYGSYVNGLSVNETTNIIPAHQGFYVHCNQPTGQVGVNSSAQVIDHKAFLKSGELSTDNTLRLTAQGNGYSDETLLRFDDLATQAYDQGMDAFKIMGMDEAPQLFTSNDAQEKFSINSSSAVENVDLGFHCGIPGIYSIRWEGQLSFANDKDLFLEDLKTGTLIDLKKQMEYSFAYDQGEDDHRFILHFYGPNAITTPVENQINVFAYENQILIQNEKINQATVNIFNLMGQKIYSEKIQKGNSTIELNTQGYFIVVIESNSYAQSSKIMLR